jgi:hypothetical protein
MTRRGKALPARAVERVAGPASAAARSLCPDRALIPLPSRRVRGHARNVKRRGCCLPCRPYDSIGTRRQRPRDWGWFRGRGSTRAGGPSLEDACTARTTRRRRDGPGAPRERGSSRQASRAEQPTSHLQPSPLSGSVAAPSTVRPPPLLLSPGPSSSRPGRPAAWFGLGPRWLRLPSDGRPHHDAPPETPPPAGTTLSRVIVATVGRQPPPAPSTSLIPSRPTTRRPPWQHACCPEGSRRRRSSVDLEQPSRAKEALPDRCVCSTSWSVAGPS